MLGEWVAEVPSCPATSLLAGVLVYSGDYPEPHNSLATLLLPLLFTPPLSSSWLPLSVVPDPALNPPLCLGSGPLTCCLLCCGALSPPGATLSPAPEALLAILCPPSLHPQPCGIPLDLQPQLCVLFCVPTPHHVSPGSTSAVCLRSVYLGDT